MKKKKKKKKKGKKLHLNFFFFFLGNINKFQWRTFPRSSLTNYISKHVNFLTPLTKKDTFIYYLYK